MNNLNRFSFWFNSEFGSPFPENLKYLGIWQHKLQWLFGAFTCTWRATWTWGTSSSWSRLALSMPLRRNNNMSGAYLVQSAANNCDCLAVATAVAATVFSHDWVSFGFSFRVYGAVWCMVIGVWEMPRSAPIHLGQAINVTTSIWFWVSNFLLRWFLRFWKFN